jgi:RNA polymerase sigma factor for flagellar operon FliA
LQGSSLSVDDEIADAQNVIDALIPAYLLSLESDAIPEVADPQALTREQIEERELIGFVLGLLKSLSDDEQQLINELYFRHRSMTNLAEQMGVTKSWISRLHSRAIRHLRELMRERGLLDG